MSKASSAPQTDKGEKKTETARAFRLYLWPRSLAGQLIAALMLALILAQIISISLFSMERRSIALIATRGQVLERTASVVRLLNQTDIGLHQRVIQAAEGPTVRFSLHDDTKLKRPQPGSPEARLAERLENRAGLASGSVRFNKLSDARDSEPETHIDFPKGGDTSELSREPRPGMGMNMGPKADDFEPYSEQRTDIAEDDGWRRSRRWRAWSGEGKGMKGFRDRNQTVLALDMKIAVPLESGRWLQVRTGMPSPPAEWGRPFLVSLFVTAACIFLVVLLTVRKLTAPLRALERASRKLGRGETIEPLSEEGPKEIRSTITAFNAMQERLMRFVQDRTRMLAAVSHDLRTPITTMRLRAEFIDDEDMREKLLETLAEMQAMTDAVLAFAREDASSEETREVDLAALISSMAEDYQEFGKEVSFEGPDSLIYSCRQVSLKRALRNLTENALRYAGDAHLSLYKTETHIVIDICDTGPGIPADKLDEVFSPFFRVEGSRNLETGGVGLGLSITRTILRGHGGDVMLANKPQGGLKATISLPL